MQWQLALASSIIWLVAVAAVAVPLYLATGRRPVALFAGFALLGVAALPWAAYRWLVRREERRRTVPEQ